MSSTFIYLNCAYSWWFVSLGVAILDNKEEEGLIIELDCNAKLGKDIIKGDPHDMSGNGKILWDIIQRRSCTVVNSTEKCKGVITRSRMKSGIKEESVLATSDKWIFNRVEQKNRRQKCKNISYHFLNNFATKFPF